MGFLLVIVTASACMTNSNDDSPVSTHRRLAGWSRRNRAQYRNTIKGLQQKRARERTQQKLALARKRSLSRGRANVRSRSTSPRRVTPKPVKRAVKNRQIEDFFKHVKEGMRHASGMKYTEALDSYRKAQTQVNNYSENAKHKRSMQNKLDQLRKEAQDAQKVWKQMPNVPRTVTYKDLDGKEITLRYKIQDEWNALRKLRRSDYRRRGKFVTDLIQWGGTLQKLMGKALKHDSRFKSDIPLIKKRLAVYHQMKSTLDDSKRPEIKIP